MKELELGVLRLSHHRGAGASSRSLVPSEVNYFTEKCEMRLVSGETEHDEVGVLAIHTVAAIRRVIWLGALVADKLHYLVLPWNDIR